VYVCVSVCVPACLSVCLSVCASALTCSLAHSPNPPPPPPMQLNHASFLETRTSIRFIDGVFDITSPRNTPSGEHVYISYGSKSNAELLVCYGFSLVNNPHDTVSLQLLMQPSSSSSSSSLPLSSSLALSSSWHHRLNGDDAVEHQVEHPGEHPVLCDDDDDGPSPSSSFLLQAMSLGNPAAELFQRRFASATVPVATETGAAGAIGEGSAPGQEGWDLMAVSRAMPLTSSADASTRTAVTTMTVRVALAWHDNAGGDVVCSCADNDQSLSSLLQSNRMNVEDAADAIRAACVQAMPLGGAASADDDEATASTCPSALMRAALVARASHTRLLAAAWEQAQRLVVAPHASDASTSSQAH
jgi:hypothetical protein